MGRSFPQGFIESVRDAADIVHVISDYVKLKPAGTRMKGLCPFHEEKTPSFSVHPANQMFYCFGCQTGGDVYKFVTLYEKLSFPEAVEFLANRFGVPVPRARSTTTVDPRDRVLAMNQSAQEYFRTQFKDERAGRCCRDYLEGRGITADTVERLGLGYTADAWENLRSHLLAQRFRADEMVKGGVTKPRQNGSGEYDRFRDRLMFPIRDVAGRIVAFGGRAIGDSEVKYINSPETPAYTKGEHLYGLDLAKEAIRREGFVIVVEGYLDVAAVLQAGFDNVVASLGTAFTSQQARLLQRYTERVVMSYDGDSAGAKAAVRSLDLLLERGFEVKVAELPAGLDPDDFIRRNGADAYGGLVRQAPEYMMFLIRREAHGRDLDRIDEKIAAVNAVLPHLARLENAIERSSWATRLADTLDIEDALVLQELQIAVKAAKPQIRQRARTSSTNSDEAGERLVNLLLRSSDHRLLCQGVIADEDLEGREVGPIVRAILSLTAEGAKIDVAGVWTALDRDEDRDLLARIALRDDPESGPGVEDCLCALQRERIDREGRRLVKKIVSSEAGAGSGAAPGDIDKQLEDIQRLARQRDQLFD